MEINKIDLGRKANDIEFLSKCSDPAFFISNVLGYTTSKFHREMIETAMKNRYVLIEVPRGHAKTTMISKGYATWLLWKEKGVEICLTSSSMKQSKKVLNEIKAMISENPFLKHLVPNDVEFSWNKEEIQTTNGNLFYVKPFNDSARGIQPQYLLYDDILRTEDSDLTAEEKEEIFWSVFFPAGQTNRCKHFVCGTPAFEGDLFDKIEKNATEIGDWKHIHYACVETDALGNWVRPLWPERYTIEELKKIQSMMSPILFAREYMCDPVAAGGSVYDKDKLAAALDHELDFSFETGKGITIIGMDVAFSKSRNADFTVIIPVTLSDEPHTITQYINDQKVTRVIDNPIVINKIIRRRSVEIPETIQIYNTVGASRIIIDKSTGGVLVGADLRASGLNVDEQDFGPTNRQVMLLNLAKVIDSGRLVIPFKDPSTKMVVDELLRELRGMQIGQTKLGAQNIVSTTQHDDMVMALALAVRTLSTVIKSNQKLMFSGERRTGTISFKEIFEKEKIRNNQIIEPKRVKVPGLE